MRFRGVRPYLGALALAVATAIIAAACGGKSASKLDLQLQLLPPAGDSSPLAGVSTVKVTVLQDGTAGVGTFSASQPWSVPAASADLRRPVVVQVEGLASDGTVLKIGRTRPVTPKTAGKHVYGIFFSPPDSFSPPPQTMPAPRTAAAVAALPDGRVVVAGGNDAGGSATASIFVYDPDAGTFTDAGASLATGRYSATACALADGSVIVGGGRDGSGTLLDDAERITLPPMGTAGAPAVTSAGTMQYAMRSQRCALLPSGRLLFAGGRLLGGEQQPQIFDPATGNWSLVAAATAARHQALVSLSDGRIVLVGGSIAGVPSSTVEVLSESGSTVSVASAQALIVPRDFPAATSYVDPVDGKEKVFVSGGGVDAAGTRTTAALESIDVSGAAPVSSLLGDRDAVHRSERGIGRLRDGRIAVLGGLDVSGGADTISDVFDPSTGLLEMVSDLPAASSFGPETIDLGDGTVFVGGGEEAGDALVYNGPVGTVAKNTRTTLQVTPLAGTTLAGSSLGGGANWTLRLYDPDSQVARYDFVSGAPTLTRPSFLVDNEPLHAVLTLSSADGTALAWGATSLAIDEARQTLLQTSSLGLVVGRVGAFTLSPKSLPHPHSEAAGAVMTDGRIVEVAGIGGPNAVDFYDPGTGEGSSAASLAIGRNEVRFFVDATNLHLVGGLNNGNVVTTAHTVVDLRTGVLTSGTAFPAPGVHLNWMVPIGGGKVFSYGNSDAQPVPTPDAHIYNGASWTATITASADKRSNLRACLIPTDGHVIITGGLSSNGTLAVEKSAILYDTAAQSFASTTDMKLARRDHTAFPAGANHVIVCGGIATTGPSVNRVATCEVYNATLKTWTDATGSLSVPRDDLVSVPYGPTQELIVGGSTTTGSVANVDLVDFSNIAAVTVTPFGMLLAPRKDVTAVALPDGRIEILGGHDSAATTVNLSSVEVWTPAVWKNPFGYQ